MKNPHTWRYHSAQVLLAILGMGIIAQIVRIQNSPQADAIRGQAGIYSGEWRTLYPARGEIYDRRGNLLAGNQTVYEIGVDLKFVRNPHTIALALSVQLGLDYTTIYNKITQPPPDIMYLVLADFVPADKASELMHLQEVLENEPGDSNDPDRHSLAGLGFKAHLQRSYPEGALAANVLGFVTQERRGYYGAEEKYDSLLAGVPVIRWVPTDPNRAEELPQVSPGTSLILTLDREIQAAVEDILDAAVANTGAESGVIIVMDPRNGEVLAMAATPRLNLNEYWQYGSIYPGETPFNRAISQAYEPGSVLKILTMAAALDAGAVQPQTPFLDTGVIVVGGVNIQNWDQHAWGPQDMTTCLQHSLNVCLAWVATQLGTDNFYTYMKRFGLGHTTGIDLAGESAGRLKIPGDTDWYPVDLGTNAFGQGIAVTPIQMVMAASAIANDGQMVAPHLLYAKVNNGKQYNTTPQIVGTPISPATARMLNEMLAISLEGESSIALVPGYRVAGKTGTAQIPTPQRTYTADVTNTSFVGWGPVDDPRFLVYVWLEKPKSSIWGSEVAAPVFKQVVEKLVVLMAIPPDHIRLQLAGQ